MLSSCVFTLLSLNIYIFLIPYHFSVFVFVFKSSHSSLPGDWFLGSLILSYSLPFFLLFFHFHSLYLNSLLEFFILFCFPSLLDHILILVSLIFPIFSYCFKHLYLWQKFIKMPLVTEEKISKSPSCIFSNWVKSINPYLQAMALTQKYVHLYC